MMHDPGVHEFLRAIEMTERWLARHFAGGAQPPAVQRFVDSLSRYLRASRRYCLGANASRSELDRRRKKIQRAWTTLWEMRFGA